MDIFSCFDGVIEFAKDRIDAMMDFWDDLGEDKKKLFLGCLIATAAIVVVGSVAYNIGKARGAELAFDEDDDF